MSAPSNRRDLIHGETGLTSEKCVCGGRKDKNKSVCFQCYRAIPLAVGSALYRRMGDGYEAAWDRAMEELRKAGRIQ